MLGRGSPGRHEGQDPRAEAGEKSGQQGWDGRTGWDLTGTLDSWSSGKGGVAEV